MTIANPRAEDVIVRLFGDIAIIQSRTADTSPDGGHGGGRYTDVWHRHAGAWRCVSAHVTRL